MSKFKQKEKRTVPQPPSGSLSDIVFMLLFFFMVTTTMRETESKVMVTLPEASEVAKLERKDLTSYINIGTPIRSLWKPYLYHAFSLTHCCCHHKEEQEHEHDVGK